MPNERDDLSKFRDAFLDYLEGDRDEPPALEDLPGEQRRAAEAFIESITAARGVDPYASRPSSEELLASRPPTSDRGSDLGEVLQGHLRLTVDPRALVTPDAASAAVGLASELVIQARGMRIRVVREGTSADLDYAFTSKGRRNCQTYSMRSADSNAVLYTTTWASSPSQGVIVDRGDVHTELSRLPLARGGRLGCDVRVTDAATACEEWLTGIIPNFSSL